MNDTTGNLLDVVLVLGHFMTGPDNLVGSNLTKKFRIRNTAKGDLHQTITTI